ncbi:MAG: hypothetical protein LQ349_009916 [Xanthoria aureola]|nr:MAG: hypothetical protein LQ349_009916 [Xanthoria aureola]
MASTRIRGGTPIEYEPAQPTYRITDPDLLAELDHLNELSRRRWESHIQQSEEQTRAEYQYHPPPEMLDSDSDDSASSHGLPSPARSPPRALERQPQTVPQPNTHLSTAKSTQSPHLSSVGDTLEHEQQLSSSSSTQSAVQVDEFLPVPLDPTYSLPANNPLGATATATNPQSPHGKPSSRCKPRGRSSIIVTRSKSSASTVFPALPYIHRQRRRRRRPARPTPAAKAKRP